MIAVFQASQTDLIDQPAMLARSAADPIKLRLVARRLPPEAAETNRRRARRVAQKKGFTLSRDALKAAGWIILATSLPAAFASQDILALYRLRWRVELAFKRLKSAIGLKRPPGTDERSARAFRLAQLLMIMLLEPQIDAFEASPHWAIAA